MVTTTLIYINEMIVLPNLLIRVCHVFSAIPSLNMDIVHVRKWKEKSKQRGRERERDRDECLIINVFWILCTLISQKASPQNENYFRICHAKNSPHSKANDLIYVLYTQKVSPFSLSHSLEWCLVLLWLSEIRNWNRNVKWLFPNIRKLSSNLFPIFTHSRLFLSLPPPLFHTSAPTFSP